MNQQVLQQMQLVGQFSPNMMILEEVSSSEMINSPLMIPECLARIFEYLRGERSSLHSCLLVNRSWCRIVVPILWREPFKLLKDKADASLLRTYFSCIEDQDQLQSMQDWMTFPSEVPLPQRATFDYPIFLRHLCCKTMFETIENWLLTTASVEIQRHYKDISVQLIASNFFQLLMNKCPILETLILWSGASNSIPITGSLSGTNTCLSRIVSLQVEGNYHDIDLWSISQRCHSLKQLTIDVEISVNSMNMLHNLVHVQRELEHFRLVFRPEDKVFTNKVQPELLNALANHPNHLNTIEFNRCNFIDCPSLEALSECNNIRHLVLWKCVGLGPGKMYSLYKVNFGQLQRLEIYVHPGVAADMVIKMIRDSNNQLQSLRLAGITPQSELPSVLSVMTRHCQNLTDCRLVLKDGDNNAFNALLTFLGVSLKLEILYITFTDRVYPICNYEDIAKHLPNGLRELVFRDFLFSPASLANFLENMTPTYHSLSFSKRHFDQQHIDVIFKYVKNRSNLFRLMRHPRYMSIKAKSEP
ncbi:19040_t:CDS:2 [Funneliformis geosporum]|uniref:19040_t:CDS:1 n=1 Tax=Funneliformis geosporum TaxID=1117311 RepID=A0A9W4SM00_9GLOM|nr:19040_t:CDS:2 [Funneliformis geosporum]